MFLVVFASLIGVLAAQMPAGKGPMTRGCCGPRRFTSTMLLVGATEIPGGKPAITDSVVLLDADWDMQMERLQMKNRNASTGLVSTVDVYMDYNNSKTYSLAQGMCYITPLMRKMQPLCIQPNATYMGTFTLGYGQKTVMVDSWSELTVNGQTVHLQVQRDTCQTVHMSTYGVLAGGESELLSYTFLDMKAGMLSADDTFNLPAACKNAITIPVGK